MYLLRQKNVDPVCWVDNFLSDDEIQKIIDHVNGLPTENARVGSSLFKEKKKKFTADYHVKDLNQGYIPRDRVTNIKWIDSNPEINWLYDKLVDIVNQINSDNFNMTLRFIETLQFSEYTQEQKSFYKRHFDCPDSGQVESFIDIRKLSFSVQLTEEREYDGGELIIYKYGKELVAPKSKGTIIFFESNLSHEVKPVTKGIRHSLVGWVQGPNVR